MGKLINSCLLISSLPDSACRTLVDIESNPKTRKLLVFYTGSNSFLLLSSGKIKL